MEFQFVLKTMVLNLLVRKWFFLISGWFALRASRSTTWPCSLSLGDPPDGDAIASNFIFLEPQARHAVLDLHVVHSPSRFFLSETRSCCIWICFGQERWLGSAGICSTVLMSRWYRVDESHLAAWQREKWDNNMFKNNNKRLNLYIKRVRNAINLLATALIYLYLLYSANDDISLKKRANGDLRHTIK